MADFLFGSKPVDIAEAKAKFAEMTKDVPDDPFILPQDSQRLTIFAASFGILHAFHTYPYLERDHDALRRLATQLSDNSLFIWSESTNDVKMFKRLLRSAFVVGYRMGSSQLQAMKPEDRIASLQIICSVDNILAHQHFDTVVRNRMQELGVETIYDLI